MDFIEIDDSVDYDNMGYVENETFFENVIHNDNTDENNDENDNDEFNRFFPQQNYLPPRLVDNKTFYQDFITKNPHRQQNKQPVSASILKTNVTPTLSEKKVTYDDILSSLNMKVINGKLQIVRGNDTQNQVPQTPQPKKGKVNSPSQIYTKQNDFYNKFLQAKQQQMVEEDEELTPEQIAAQQQYHKRLMMIQYIKNQQQRIRVGQVKSKKMKFV